MNQPVIICGLGRVGWPVLEYLKAAGLPVVAVDLRCTADDPRLAGVRFIRGDCQRREVLEQAGLSEARGVLILTSDDLVNISTTMMIRHLHRQVRVIVRLFNQNLISRLGQAVANVQAMSVSALTAPVLALTALSGEALGSFAIDGKPRLVSELHANHHPSLIGQSLGQLANRYDLAVVAYFPKGAAPLFLEVNADTKLSDGDRLIVCGRAEKLGPLLAAEESDWLPQLRLAGGIRQFSRVIGRTFAEIDTPVMVCTVVLLLVIGLSTLVYHLGMGLAPADGLLRTIAVMAVGDNLHEEELVQPWQKVFVALLRLMGMAVVAAFTAILTNYLLRARLGTALEIRRVPESGHVVVCGLGSIGYRVVEELLRRGERVVVIERSADSRFVTTTRRLGPAVITGDATVPEVLRQANAGTARAVVAATENQLSNLEIALLVRELNSRQRVVLRLSDPFLAQVLREAANIRLALSTSALAAPAFVAALFGDRVLNLFLIAGKVFAVVELTIQADETALLHQSIRALSVDYRFLPLALMPAQKGLTMQASYRLAEGDRLTGILAVPDLARLLRRELPATDWSIQVSAFPIPARGWLAQLLRTQRQLDGDTAERELQHFPIELGHGLTRGQAEDLLALCQRERVTASLRQVGS